MVKIVVLRTFLHCSKVGSNISFFYIFTQCGKYCQKGVFHTFAQVNKVDQKIIIHMFLIFIWYYKLMTDNQFRQQQKFKNKMTLLALIYKKKVLK